MAGLKGLAGKAKQFLSKNPDKAQQGIDRAADFVDEKTGGKHRDKIDKATDRAKDYVGGEESKGQQPPAEKRGGEQAKQDDQQGKQDKQDKQGKQGKQD